MYGNFHSAKMHTLHFIFKTRDRWQQLIGKIIFHLRFLIISIETQACTDIRSRDLNKLSKTLIIESLDQKETPTMKIEEIFGEYFHPDFQASLCARSHQLGGVISLFTG